jgi:hypothetical protein
MHAMVVQEADPVEPGDTIKVERRSATQQSAMESVSATERVHSAL